MKILLTGGRGQLGQAIKELAPSQIDNNLIQVFDPSKSELNISDEKNCNSFISNYRPDWVINSAAFTNVDEAENFSEEAYLVNGQAPLFLSRAVKRYGGKLIQISTDFVFDGKKEFPYQISDKRNPLSVYGKSKEKGEIAVEQILHPQGKGLILRTSWLLGPTRRNFLLTMLNLFKTKKEINVVSDQIGCPTSTNTLGKLIWRFIEKFKDNEMPITPYLHCCDDGYASWYEIAKFIDFSKKIGLIDNFVKIMPIKSSEYNALAKDRYIHYWIIVSQKLN